jgi:hypothetical protein
MIDKRASNTMTRATNQAGADAHDDYGVPETTVVESFAGTIVGSRNGIGVRGCMRLHGLALRLCERSHAAEDAEELFDIAAIDKKGNCVFSLGHFGENEVVAIWRKLGASSGLALMLQNPDGSLLEPYPQIGGVALGTIHIRRRHGLLRHRRPRFLTRRKVGQPSARPLVFRERDITANPKR